MGWRRNSPRQPATRLSARRASNQQPAMGSRTVCPRRLDRVQYQIMFDRLVVSFLVDEVVGGFFISVPPGHIACVYDRGRGVLKKVWGPGLHLKIPFWQIAKLFNAQIVEYTIRENFDLKIKEALGDMPVKTTTK